MITWLGRLRFEHSKRKALAAQLPGFLIRYLEQPLPPTDLPASTASLLAVDFETNGLDPIQDHILSIGAVAVDGEAISIGSGWHTLVTTGRELDASIVPIHGITHDMVRKGDPILTAIEALFDRLHGRILLAHHATIETGFLQAILMKMYGVKIPFAVIDTLAIEQKIQGHRPQPKSVRLLEARKRYGLPVYNSHHALTDALSAAELFLAQRQHRFSDVPLSRLLSYFS